MTNQHTQNTNHEPTSSAASELGNHSPVMKQMEIGGLLNGRGLMADTHMRHQFQHHPMQMNSSAYGLGHHMMPSYGHQHAMSQPNLPAYSPMSSLQHESMMPSTYMPRHTHAGSSDQLDSRNVRPRSEPVPKAFSCSTCSKGFARRSDLARHERIHSGVRPHACDFPGCGKQFIQRSALTVHARVHTGEKPHMCERCGKPFSDSSSLARHRRIHSGKRPYKCPFANCQKTFTRRTTLTRHQNHHTGTVEQAQAETNARLSMTQPNSQPQSTNSSYSDAVSRHSATSPTGTLSISPTQDVHSIQNSVNQSSEYQYMAHQNQAQPQHMQNEYHPGAVRSQPTYNNSSVATFNNPGQIQAGMVSYPTRFVPPQHQETSIVNSSTVSASPHMAATSWQANNGLPTPVSIDGYQYQDQSFQPSTMYYQDSNLRRPQSTEPQDGGYAMPARTMAPQLVSGNMHAMPAQWGGMPMGIHHDIKQERGFA